MFFFIISLIFVFVFLRLLTLRQFKFSLIYDKVFKRKKKKRKGKYNEIETFACIVYWIVTDPAKK